MLREVFSKIIPIKRFFYYISDKMFLVYFDLRVEI